MVDTAPSEKARLIERSYRAPPTETPAPPAYVVGAMWIARGLPEGAVRRTTTPATPRTAPALKMRVDTVAVE